MARIACLYDARADRSLEDQKGKDSPLDAIKNTVVRLAIRVVLRIWASSGNWQRHWHHS